MLARHKNLLKWRQENNARLCDDPNWYDVQYAGWWVWGISNYSGAGWCTGRVQDQRPHIGSGMGVSRQARSCRADAVDGQRLVDWFQQLSQRLANVIVLNRSWEAAVTPASLMDYPSRRSALVGVYLDPPYMQKNRSGNLYVSDVNNNSSDIAQAAYEWAIQNGMKYRIAYSCMFDDFPTPDGWTHQEIQTLNMVKKHRTEKVMFSPSCLLSAQVDLFA